MKNIKVTVRRHNPPARVKRGERARVTSRARERLRGSVLRYDSPLKPVVDSKEWDSNN